jgi:hypothetical protein
MHKINNFWGENIVRRFAFRLYVAALSSSFSSTKCIYSRRNVRREFVRSTKWHSANSMFVEKKLNCYWPLKQHDIIERFSVWCSKLTDRWCLAFSPTRHFDEHWGDTLGEGMGDGLTRWRVRSLAGVPFMGKLVSCWLNGKLMKWWVDIIASAKLMKYQIDEKLSWPNSKYTKW